MRLANAISEDPPVGSRFLHEEARSGMPLGVADNYRYWGEDTVFIKDMQGCLIRDHDGREYVDFRLGYGPIILGYRDPRIDHAVIRCITGKGTMCGFSTELEAPLVASIKSLCPNIEKLRFANSGTEAVLAAVRTARGFTCRDKIIVVEGGFHGLYDEMMWKADIENWTPGSNSIPDIIPFGAGIPKSSQEHIRFLPLNDEERLQDIFEREGLAIAAVIIEPIMGNCGGISATPAYMQALKRACEANGSLLIIDEVKTGFRVAKGGAQEIYGIHADLTTYAKALGNGYPVAAFGGRADVMDRISPGKNGVVHGGTYTANLIAMSAAQATIDVLRTTQALKTVAETGDAIKAVLSSIFFRFSIPYVFSGHSSMFGIHFVETEPCNYRDWRRSDNALYKKFATHMISEGVMLEPDSREPWFLCEAHAQLNLSWLEDVATKSLRAALE